MTHAEPSPPATIPHRFHWRRLFQYRLRTLLILMTACAVFFAFLGMWSHNARKQRAFVAELQQRGGATVYDFQESPVKQKPFWPAWLVDRLGVDYFATVVSVVCPNSYTDADLASLQTRDLNGLKTLDLSETFITNAGLRHLQTWPNLAALVISCTQVTDSGLEYLKNLKKLQSLDLHNTQITDAGLKHLQSLPDLEWLDVRETKVSDAGLDYILGHRKLQSLWLSKTQVTDAGLPRLNSLGDLRNLDLGETKITDAGLVHLKRFRALELLILRDTQVTDAGVDQLTGFSELKILHLQRTHVTPARVARLKQKLPNCNIAY